MTHNSNNSHPTEHSTTVHKRELLSKLEAIIKALNDKGEKTDNGAVPVLREAVDLSTLTTDEQALATSLALLKADNPAATVKDKDSPVKKDSPTKANAAEMVSAAHRQPAAKEPSRQKKRPTHMEKTPPLKEDNPFLPRHIRARLYRGNYSHEDRTAESTKKTTAASKHPTSTAEDLHEAIIDNLITLYLPKIEADLRRRLRALVAEKDSL